MARPKKTIDADQVERLASIGCSVEEIAVALACNKRTLERRFVAALEKGRAGLRTRLRHKQVQLALAGDKTMLIWLGKQLLGQKERTESDVTAKTEVVTIDRVPPRSQDEDRNS